MSQSVVVTRSATGSGKARSRARNSGGGGVAAGSGRGSIVAPSPAPAKPTTNAVAIADVDESVPIRKLSPEEQKRADLQSRLHPSLVAVVDRLKDPKLAASADESKFVHDGKAEVQIWLTEKSEATLAKLKALGFEVVLDPKSAKLVIGRLSIDKLAALAEIAEVRYVAPQMMK